MKFCLIGKMKDVLKLLKLLAEIEWEFPNLAASMDNCVINTHTGGEHAI